MAFLFNFKAIKMPELCNVTLNSATGLIHGFAKTLVFLQWHNILKFDKTLDPLLDQ